MTVKFELSKDALAPGEEAVASIHLTIAPGYHAYAPGSPEENGPLTLAATGFDLVGAPEGPPPTRKVNDLTKETLLEYRGTLTLKQTVRAPATGIVEAPTLTLSAVVCDERTCLPPATWKARFDVKALPGPAQGSNGAGPAPKAKDSVKTDEANLTTDRLRKMSFGEFLAWSSFGGWASLFTPCVFPMIPITVSFFSKRAGGRRSRAVGLASTYALGIIATFTLIGVVVSLAFGATSLASFATNTWVNLVMGALFVVLGLSLLGLFQIAAPSSLTNKIEEAKSETKNDFVMTLLMAIAFTLASFTCTVPVLGALLGLAAQGSPMRPAAGMLAYSATFAAPFFLLALFPRVLQKLPRGGAWLEVVKISMGFVELAAALKFLSNADIGADAQILTRPLFLAVWVAIFLALALYLFGILRMPGAEGEVGAIRAVFGVGSLSLALYLFAGLFGLTYGQFVESFLPPAKYGSQGVVTNGTGAPTFHLTWVEDLDEGLRDGRAQNRRIFLNFTGDQCVNCRGMEQGMFPRPAVAAELEKMTRVEMTLDRESTPKLAERSARYREFEEKTFDTTARPFYVILEADGKTVVDTFAGSTPDEAKFLRFLRGEAVK
jgi:thiol:disulfide interchange protein DsbD